MSALRKVIVSKDVGRKDEKTGRLKHVAEPIGEALFHGFGVDSYQADGGVMTYCVASVEFPDGKVDTVYPTLSHTPVDPSPLDEVVDEPFDPLDESDKGVFLA